MTPTPKDPIAERLREEAMNRRLERGVHEDNYDFHDRAFLAGARAHARILQELAGQGDEEAAEKYAEAEWGPKDQIDPDVEGCYFDQCKDAYLAACSAKNAEIARLKDEIAQLKSDLEISERTGGYGF